MPGTLRRRKRYEQSEKVKAFRLGVCLAYVLVLVSLFAVLSNSANPLAPLPPNLNLFMLLLSVFLSTLLLLPLI